MNTIIPNSQLLYHRYFITINTTVILIGAAPPGCVQSQ